MILKRSTETGLLFQSQSPTWEDLGPDIWNVDIWLDVPEDFDSADFF